MYIATGSCIITCLMSGVELDTTAPLQTDKDDSSTNPSTDNVPKRRGLTFASAQPLPDAVTKSVEAASKFHHAIAEDHRAPSRTTAVSKTKLRNTPSRPSGKRRRALQRKQKKLAKQGVVDAGKQSAPDGDGNSTSAETSAQMDELVRAVAQQKGMNARQVRRTIARKSKKNGTPSATPEQIQKTLRSLGVSL